MLYVGALQINHFQARVIPTYGVSVQVYHRLHSPLALSPDNRISWLGIHIDGMWLPRWLDWKTVTYAKKSHPK